MEQPERVGQWKRRLILLGTVCVVVVLLYGLRSQWLPSVGRWLDVSTPPRKTQYVMVLGGANDRRPFVAAALHRRGYTQQVIIPRLAPSPDVLSGNAPPTHEVMKRVFLNRGVVQEDLLILDTQIRTTFDEAEALRQFLASRPDAEVAIVTDDYHTRRTRWVFRRSLGDQAANVYFIAGPVEGVTPDNWWKTREGLKAYTNEYLKLAYYWCRFGWGLAWIGALVLLVVLVRLRRVIFGSRRVHSGC